MTTVYTKFMLPWQPFQDVLTHFFGKHIKLNYHHLQSSKFHKYLENFILSELINVALRYIMLQRHSAYSTCKWTFYG